MNKRVVGHLLKHGRASVGEIIKAKAASSYTAYATLDQLKGLGIISFKAGKAEVLENPLTVAFQKLFYEGFNVSILSKPNLQLFAAVLSQKTAEEAAEELGKSVSNTRRLLRNLAQFISRNGKYYRLSASNAALYEFVGLIAKTSHTAYWQKGGERLLKIPKEFEAKGTLTAFSAFPQHGLEIHPSHTYLYQPQKKLKPEEILSHALKFSQNANDLALCLLFYLKNMHKINVLEVEKICEHLGVMDLWLDCVAYLEDQPVKNRPLFLPRPEFLEKASIYGIRIRKRFEATEISTLLNQADQNMPKKAKLFLIGGNALIEHQAKNSTKDIDVVARTLEEGKAFCKALKRMGFSETGRKELQYTELGAFVMLEKQGAPRIDLFVGKVCKALEFSNRMAKRSRKSGGEKLELYLACLEDIFLLKTISSRDSDLVDCQSILSKATLRWPIIYAEILAQEKNLEGLKELVILDHLEVLEKRLGVKIPLTKKVLRLSLEKSILFLARSPVTVREIRAKLNFPEPTIRNTLTRMVKEKKVAKIGKKPFKILITGKVTQFKKLIKGHEKLLKAIGNL